MSEVLLRVGIDPQHYQAERGPVLLRPERIVSPGARAAWALSSQVNQLPDADRCFQNLALSGSLFFHPPRLPLGHAARGGPERGQR